MNGIDLRALAGLTLRNPQQAGEALLTLQLPMNVRWALAVLTVSLAGVLAWIATAIMGPLPDEPDAAFLVWLSQQPAVLALGQFVGMIIAAALMAGVGRMFGGEGRFGDALILTVWIEAMMLCVQAVQLLLLPIAPGFAGMLSLVSVGMFFYLTVQFTKALHGFRNGWLVLLGVFATLITLSFVLVFLLAALGLLPQIPEVPA